MNTPGRAISPGGCMIKIIHLTGGGIPSWHGQRDAPARDGWWWTITAPGGLQLGAVYIGPDLPTPEDLALAAAEPGDIPDGISEDTIRRARSRAADLTRAAIDLAALTEALPGLAVALDALTAATGER